MHGHGPGVPCGMHLGGAQILLTDSLDRLCADRFALVPVAEGNPDETSSRIRKAAKWQQPPVIGSG